MTDGIHEGNPLRSNVFWNEEQVKDREREAVREFAKKLAKTWREAAAEGFSGGPGPLFGAGISKGFEACANLVECAAEELGK